MPRLAASLPEEIPELARFLAAADLMAGREISGIEPDPSPQAAAYSGCAFALTDANGEETRAVFRAAKVTPAKAGLFVTLWKRDTCGGTRPYRASDGVDVLYVAARTDDGYGYFTFAARDLAEAGILTAGKSAGKRGFRLYTPWDGQLNATAARAWSWQRRFFTVPGR